MFLKNLKITLRNKQDLKVILNFEVPNYLHREVPVETD